MVPVKRVDANQKSIVRDLRQAGLSVECIHVVGHGVPDLLVGCQGRTFIFEVKMPCAGLTPDEHKWHENWRGQVDIIHCAEDALRIIGMVA